MELANQPYPLRVYDEDEMYYTYSFQTEKGLTYFITLNLWDETLDVEFQTESGPGQSNQGILNTGNAFRVFATVADAIKKYIKTRTVNQIEFMSKKSEPSRIKLYDAIARVLPKYIPFYLDGKTEDPKMPNYVAYKFVRKGTQ